MEARLVGVKGSHNGVQTDDGGRYAAGQSFQGQGGRGQSRGQACQQHGAPSQVGQRQSIQGQSIQGQGDQGQGGQRQGVQGLHGSVGGVNCRRGKYSLSKIDGFKREEVLPSTKLPSICHIYYCLTNI